MLLPIGQEDNVVRRHPWVSYAILLLNVAVHFALPYTYDGRGLERKQSEKFDEVVQFLIDHPHVEMPARLEPYDNETFRALRDRERRRRPTPGPRQTELDRERLDQLVAELDALGADSPFQRLGYIPAHPRPRSLLTSMFVHGDWIHLGGNMLFFFVSGPFIEDLFGRPLFAGFYLLSGVVATLAHAAKAPGSEIPLVGASGAIAGVMGAFLVRLARRRIRFRYMPLFPLSVRGFNFLMPAFVVLPLWLAEQLWYASRDPEAGVAWWAHIGGFAFGALAAGAMKVLQVEERFINPGIEKEISLEQHPGLEKALEARLAGDYAAARAELAAVLKAEPNNLDAWAEACELGVAGGDPKELGPAACRLLDLHIRQGDRDAAFALVYDLLQRAPDRSLPARFHLSAAGLAEKAGDFRLALELYDHAAAAATKTVEGARALLRKGEVLRQAGDVRGARAAYEAARAHPGCNEALAAHVERGFAALSRSA